MSSAPSQQIAAFNWSVLFAGIALVLATVGAYQNSFEGPLIFDDVPAIRDNPTIRSLWPISTVLSPPSDSGITVNGRPLVNLSLAVNYAAGGTNVFGYHLVNLLIHLGAGLALFGIVRRTLELPALRHDFETGPGPVLAAFTVALLWLMHPLQTESVTYIIQRAESLVGLFYLLTFYCFIRSNSSPRPARWQALAVLSCLCGMASKEVMASAPLLVLLFDRAVVSGTFREAWRRNRTLYLGLATTWLLLAWLVAGTGNRGGTAGFGAGGMSSWHYALTQCFAIGRYLRLTFWPDNLIFDYGIALEERLLPVLPQALLIVSLLGATIYTLSRHPLLGFLGLWFFAILGPSSSVIPIATEVIAEHRMYLPLVAIVAFAALGTMRRFGFASAYGFWAVGLVFGAITHQRNEVYRDELLLWRETQQRYPSNARAHNNVGEILYRHERHQEALPHFREAVRLLPTYVDALNNLGNALAQLGPAAEALAPLTRALELNPNSAETHNNLGTAYYQLNRPIEAVARYEETIRLKPGYAEAHNNLGVVQMDLGRVTEAVPHFLTALRLKPDYADANYNLGNALSQLGRETEAIAQFREAIRLRPSYAQAHNNLGGILFKAGQAAEAEHHYREAIRHKPIYPDAHNNLGVAHFQARKIEQAIAQFETALLQKPDYNDARSNLAEAHNHLGANYFKEGNLSDARRAFEHVLKIQPQRASGHKNLGIVLLRLGHAAEAEKHLIEALRIQPDFPDAKKDLEDLRSRIRATSPR